MRTYLENGVVLEMPSKVRYKIIGKPIGEGGCSIVYAAKKYIPAVNGEFSESPIDFAIKECFPVTEGLNIFRENDGNIIAGDEESEAYLNTVKQMQKNEASVSARVFNVGFRTTPVLETYENASIIEPDGQAKPTNNLISILGSLSEKGQSIKSLLADSENKRLTAEQTFRITEQLLYALEDVHKAGFLHLDIQDGNVFLHGSLENRNNMVYLLDFGTAKELLSNGLSCEINPKELYSTQGFTSPEILLCEDETLRLGCQADLYSVGALMLYLLTGQKLSSKELIEHEGKSYIPKFALQSTKCPKHLIDRMQNIVSKALAVDIDDRYSTAAEMLEDVTDFLEAIAPYRNPLASNTYDAFICYKHNKLDNLAAKTLRDSLERFRAKLLYKNYKQKIESVFMDEGELSSCADFGNRINDALKRSEWLIVVCSGETKESRWVNEEIRTFLKYHDKSHVLAVITEGEPDEVYPLELKKNGLDASSLYAADARADGDLNKTKKLIQTDVRLKIAAAILGVTYDDLKQRKKIYKKKIILGIIVLLVVVFSSLFIVPQMRKLAVYNNAKELYYCGDYVSAMNEFKKTKGYKDTEMYLSLIKSEPDYWREAPVKSIINIGHDPNGDELSWIILEKNDETALVISKKAIECKEYNKSNISSYWSISDIRKWLNSEFFEESFGDDELPYITFIRRNDEIDYVSLLTADEADYYFESNKERMCIASANCIENGVQCDSENRCRWWLMDNNTDVIKIEDPASMDFFSEITAPYVDYKGKIRKKQESKLKTVDTAVAVRPVLQVGFDGMNYHSNNNEANNEEIIHVPSYDHICESDDSVYVSSWSKSLFCYNKSSRKVTTVKDDGYEKITYKDGYIYGMRTANGGIGPICRYNCETKNEEILAPGVYSEYGIVGNKIYFGSGGEQYEYVMLLDGSYKETIDQNTKCIKEAVEIKDYDIIYKTNVEKQEEDIYLKTPKGKTYLGRYKMIY